MGMGRGGVEGEVGEWEEGEFVYMYNHPDVHSHRVHCSVDFVLGTKYNMYKCSLLFLAYATFVPCLPHPLLSKYPTPTLKCLMNVSTSAYSRNSATTLLQDVLTPTTFIHQRNRIHESTLSHPRQVLRACAAKHIRKNRRKER